MEITTSFGTCSNKPSIFIEQLFNSFSISTDYPGEMFATILEQITDFGNFGLNPGCGYEAKSYCQLTGKFYDLCGGFDFFEEFIRKEFSYETEFFTAAALF